jgi:hypothetical protein
MHSTFGDMATLGDFHPVLATAGVAVGNETVTVRARPAARSPRC